MTGRSGFGPLVCCFLLACCATVSGQTLQTLSSNGPTSKRLNVTFFSEGYTTNQLPDFINDVRGVLNSFFATSPYKSYSNCFNIHAVSVASAQSGSDHYSTIPARLVDTYFNSSFDNYGQERVLMIPPNPHDSTYANGQGKVDALVASLIPESDLEVVLVNDPVYGGTGGPTLVVSLDPSADEITLHEMGHSLAKLGDEYSDPFPYSNQEEPNTTTQTERALIKWNSWILPETPVPTPDVPSNFAVVGLFEGAHYHASGWFRPQHSCKMRTLDAPYCAVCREAIVLSIYNLVRPIDAFTPNAGAVELTNAQVFRITPLKAETTFTYQWFTNNVAVPNSNRTNLFVTPQALGPGLHSVRVEMHDTTQFVRNDPDRLLFDTNSWLVNVSTILAITRQPTNQHVFVGAPASFSVIASGPGPITYQWRFNGTALNGETGSTLQFANTGPEHVGNYDVIVANDSASLTSSVATLTLEMPTAPAVVTSPADRTVRAGESATFGVIATGSSPRTYFWMRDASVIATTTVPTLTIFSVQFADAGSYSVTVSNIAGVATSGTATLTVLPAQLLTAGVYSGLFFDSNQLQQAAAGLFTATVREANDFTAKIQVGKAKQNFRGAFAEDGRTTNVVSVGGTALQVILVTDPQSPDTIAGSVERESALSLLIARRGNADANLSGQYTLLIAGASNATVAPAGNGFAAARVNNGNATIAGFLADGTRLSARAPVVGTGELPVYAVAGKGALFGWLRLKPDVSTDLEGTVHWIQPAGAKLYPSGFTSTLPVIGSSYVPSAGTLFDSSLGQVVLSDGNLDVPRTNYVILGAGGRVTAAGPDKLRLKVTAQTGLFSGAITPDDERPIKVRGAILQRQRFGAGFFLGTNEAGPVYFGP